MMNRKGDLGNVFIQCDSQVKHIIKTTWDKHSQLASVVSPHTTLMVDASS